MITIVIEPGGYFSIDEMEMGISEFEFDQITHGTMPTVCYEHMLEKVKTAMFDFYRLEPSGSC